MAFVITLASIVVAVVAAVLAIWEFSGEDTMWRTVASCAIIGAGALLLYIVHYPEIVARLPEGSTLIL
jgi:cytochrome bd-type quinol oxidase subunit 2